jgi:hypothetical protein
MEGGPNAIQGKPNARSAALVPFRSQRHQQRFDIRPVDVGPNRIGKDGTERFLMFANQELMISSNSIMSSPNPAKVESSVWVAGWVIKI